MKVCSKDNWRRAWWYRPIKLDIQEAKIGTQVQCLPMLQSEFKVSLSYVVRPCPKIKKLKKERLGYSALHPWSSPVPQTWFPVVQAGFTSVILLLSLVNCLDSRPPHLPPLYICS